MTGAAALAQAQRRRQRRTLRATIIEKYLFVVHGAYRVISVINIFLLKTGSLCQTKT